MEHHRAQDGHADREQERAVDPADHRRRERRAEGAPRLALPGHRKAVEDRRRRPHCPGHPEQHGRYRVRGYDHRLQAHQEGERGIGIHVEGERQQKGQADQPAQPRNHAQDQPDEHAEGEKTDPLGVCHDRRGLDGHAEHVGFHGRPCSRLSSVRAAAVCGRCSLLRCGQLRVPLANVELEELLRVLAQDLALRPLVEERQVPDHAGQIHVPVRVVGREQEAVLPRPSP